MVIIINGPCGIGKTTLAWELLGRFDRAVMLDGDYIGAFHPGWDEDKSRPAYLRKTLHHLVAFHQQEGQYSHFVINYVFERPEALADLVGRLALLNNPVYTFRLIADESVIEQRIRGREQGDDLAWYLTRFRQLLAIQTENAKRGDLGIVVDTTALTAAGTADHIMQIVGK